MLFFRPIFSISIFSLMICQSFGRAADYLDQNSLDLIFMTESPNGIQSETPVITSEDCTCVPRQRCSAPNNNTNGEDTIVVKFLGHYCTKPQYVCCESNSITPSSSSITDLVSYPLPKPQRDCECAPIKNCQLYDGTVIKSTNGEGLINPRLGECPDSQHICCDKLRPSRQTSVAKYVRKHRSCGVRHEDGVGFKISGDNQAQFGEFPSIVIVFKKKFKDGIEFLQFNCGGSLIHLKVVLTAAHCVRSHMTKPDQLVIRAGEWDTESESETVFHQEREAEKVITHPSFNSGNKAYDVALVVLKEPFEYAENVDVVCLPPTDTDVDKANCVAAGWGKESFDADSYSNILKKLDLPLVPRADCQSTVSAFRPSFKLQDSLVCAGGEIGIDVCQGDGGGPLLCPVPNRDNVFHQVGIVSWGFGCGEKIPSFYANVPMVRTWIDDEFERLGLEKSGAYELADSA